MRLRRAAEWWAVNAHLGNGEKLTTTWHETEAAALIEIGRHKITAATHGTTLTHCHYPLTPMEITHA